MTSKLEFAEKWEKSTPEERRARLDELAAQHTELDDDGLREHDALATLVAVDEDELLRENDGAGLEGEQ